FDAEGIGIPFPQRGVHLYIAEGSSKQTLAGLSKGRVAGEGSNPQPYELNDNGDIRPDERTRSRPVRQDVIQKT
ncbi:MAG: hypothetical protein PVI39_13470, partial [Desulfobacteraceae bacterium]